VTLKDNITLTLRERGKIKQRWEGQNIWLDTGRTFLTELLSYSSFSPLTTIEDRRVRYIGFGIGSKNQTQLAIADNPPMSVDYPGTNIQTDMQPTVVALERPVRVSGGVYLYELPVPVVNSGNFSAKFSFTLGLTDVSYGGYLAVPLSEVAMYLSGATVSVGNNVPVAYEAFETITKTQDYTLDGVWDVRF